mgnify:FL=1
MPGQTLGEPKDQRSVNRTAKIRFSTSISSPVNDDVSIALVNTQHGGTWPKYLLRSRAPESGEWRSNFTFPPNLGGLEAWVNVYVYLPCQEYDQLEFQHAAGYLTSAEDRYVLKSQYRFEVRPGEYSLEAEIGDGRCDVRFYKVETYENRSSWAVIPPQPVEFEEHFMCILSGPVC